MMTKPPRKEDEAASIREFGTLLMNVVGVEVRCFQALKTRGSAPSLMT
jgi:hypothetical protein